MEIPGMTEAAKMQLEAAKLNLDAARQNGGLNRGNTPSPVKG
jgi:hypothetical protein